MSYGLLGSSISIFKIPTLRYSGDSKCSGLSFEFIKNAKKDDQCPSCRKLVKNHDFSNYKIKVESNTIQQYMLFITFGNHTLNNGYLLNPKAYYLNVKWVDSNNNSIIKPRVKWMRYIHLQAILIDCKIFMKNSDFRGNSEPIIIKSDVKTQYYEVFRHTKCNGVFNNIKYFV
ncbi:hypothetical protein H8356DRAFT_1343796 [Neocallimastix lanati (nom. inval.)]|nr:hypothetical protein H8356DRAFT_1343796 [Neocallimastix sp. JGI-2020a]